MNIILVVKQFGPVGGMEEYAYRLACELVKQKISLVVLCELNLSKEDFDKRIVVELGEVLKKPRWFSHLIFSRKVGNWIKKFSESDSVVHSHERVNCHHATTMHSTLYNFQKKSSIPSLRNWMNEFLERRELMTAKVIIPVSSMIGDQIRIKYPDLSEKITNPVAPGVSPINAKKKIFDPNSPVLGFMGREWERKGLPKVIDIWRELRKNIPTLQLCLAGFSYNEKIAISKDEMLSVQILGYLDNKEDFYSKIDVLVHPAKKEAYGMVIAEALSLGIPVVCSKECGIASHKEFSGVSLKESDSIKSWCTKLRCQLFPDRQDSFYNSRTWKNCAQEHLNIYKHTIL
jgi:UDP-glucose:(heptosyl)LPS alpha-1,3-glucosyltransferase